jgi:ubiquinone/menaquinone biosynthesis C-methylase UbiE
MVEPSRAPGVAEWEELAAWYDENMGDEGDLWHRTLIDPALLWVLGDVAGQRILDLACGNGYLGRKLARQGARVTAVDASEPIIARARAREEREPLGISYHVADAAHLTMFDDGTFDAVLSNMALMDIADAEAAIHEASRVLRPGGRFVFSICHPCFDVGPDPSTWVVEGTGSTAAVWRKVAHYRRAHEERIPWGAGDEVRETIGYHRPLSWYFRVLRTTQFSVTSLEEPEPTEGFKARDPVVGAGLLEVPLHCIIEARKPPFEV